MSIANKARFFLIRLAKILPFMICFIVFISYTETCLSLATSNLEEWNEYVVPYKYVSWWIAQYFEYDWTAMVVLIVLSISVETCLWNKLAILYLCLNLYEKYFFSDIELYEEYIYAIAVTNMAICAFLCYKGIKTLTK